MFNQELREKYIKFEDLGPCSFMKEGDIFITGGVAGGGKVYGVDDVHIACCNDGVRPVIFKLEMIEEDE